MTSPLRPFRFAAAIFASLAFGCARNAVLEVEMTVPAQQMGVNTFVTVEFERDEVGFTDEWGPRNPYPPVALTELPQTLAYSLVSSSADVAVQVRARFCATPDCSAQTDAATLAPAVWFTLDHPFYIGQRTGWHRTIETIPDSMPSAAIEVDRCEIEGCIEATGGANFCGINGHHFCEGG